MTKAELQAWADSEGLAVDEAAWERLERLIGLWQQYGRAMNLVGTTDAEALWEHVQEGLQCVACAERAGAVDEGCCWVDVGSGGGLPGLVVAAVRPWAVILIEPRERRAAFLDLGLAAMGGRDRWVIRGRWGVSTWNEEVVRRLEARRESSFLILSSRAVFSPGEWLERSEEAEFPRGVVLCHVDLGVERVAGREPSNVVRGSRWSVLGFLR
ncbi:RsmG family class I SAM-dependent methyltransferase [Paraliomyxa miuraensis]|uniref:RsmG family class I SAM-dependent methyltransferase n=1 Tax=Paraliomyxa miuraensis TaxID=376150 RepID=UPI0022539303|nr:RsmG family class I SAM-dependent methyltransferase [Paraliomyxa miuraensis]MCX4244059.1 class I SAM-dependent methyltransferase [Paraliomyxa miuraensis]